MADYTFKRGDVGQVIKRRLWQKLVTEVVNSTTGAITKSVTYSVIPLTGSDTVRLNLRAYNQSAGTLDSGTNGGGACTITDAANSEVSYTLQAADVATARTWAMEHEITKAGSGEVITVPDEPDTANGRTIAYLLVDILPDAGGV